LNYVVVTPARNEAAFIENLIQSMLAQTVKPLRWVIVSDGSTDGMDDIVQRHAKDHPWIVLKRMPERRERHFAGKVLAFNAGYDAVRELGYDAIASLDAANLNTWRRYAEARAKEKYPNLKLVATEVTKEDENVAREKVQTLLNAYPNLKGIIAFDSNSVPGAMRGTRAVAVQMSAQSRQVRMHCRMSISSAESASAHEVQIAAQNMACRTASAALRTMLMANRGSRTTAAVRYAVRPTP